MRFTSLLLPLALLVFSTGVQAEPVTYKIDPAHTYPSFAADHMGLSVWRGKFTRTTGSVTLDKVAKTGQVHIVVDMTSIDFGLEALNKHASGEDMFNVAKYPEAIYDGKLANFVNGKPTRVVGKLTLHGVTRPLALKIKSFKCIPMFTDNTRKRCGADAVTHFERDDFGLDGGKDYGFDMTVTLRIQVEALEAKK